MKPALCLLSKALWWSSKRNEKDIRRSDAKMIAVFLVGENTSGVLQPAGYVGACANTRYWKLQFRITGQVWKSILWKRSVLSLRHASSENFYRETLKRLQYLSDLYSSERGVDGELKNTKQKPHDWLFQINLWWSGSTDTEQHCVKPPSITQLFIWAVQAVLWFLGWEFEQSDLGAENTCWFSSVDLSYWLFQL